MVGGVEGKVQTRTSHRSRLLVRDGARWAGLLNLAEWELESFWWIGR